MKMLNRRGVGVLVAACLLFMVFSDCGVAAPPCRHSQEVRQNATSRTYCLQATVLLQSNAVVQAKAARDLLLHGPLGSAFDESFIEATMRRLLDPSVVSMDANDFLRFLRAIESTPMVEHAVAFDALLSVSLASLGFHTSATSNKERDRTTDIIVRSLVLGVINSPKQAAHFPDPLKNAFEQYMSISPVGVKNYSLLVLALRRLSFANAIRTIYGKLGAQGTALVFGPLFVDMNNENRLAPLVWAEQRNIFDLLAQIIGGMDVRNARQRVIMGQLADLYILQAASFGRAFVGVLKAHVDTVIPHASSPFRAFAYMMLSNGYVAERSSHYETVVEPESIEQRERALKRPLTTQEKSAFVKESGNSYVAEQALSPLMANINRWEKVAQQGRTDTPIEALLTKKYLAALIYLYQGRGKEFVASWSGANGVVATAGGKEALGRLAAAGKFFVTPASLSFVFSEAGGIKDLDRAELKHIKKLVGILSSPDVFAVVQHAVTQEQQITRLPKTVTKSKTLILGSPRALPRGVSTESFVRLLHLTTAVMREISQRGVLQPAPKLVREILFTCAEKYHEEETTEVQRRVLTQAISNGLVAIGEDEKALLGCWRSAGGAECVSEALCEVVVHATREIQIHGEVVVRLADSFSKPCYTDKNFVRLARRSCRRIFIPRRKTKLEIFDVVRHIVGKIRVPIAKTYQRLSCRIAGDFGGEHVCL